MYLSTGTDVQSLLVSCPCVVSRLAMIRNAHVGISSLQCKVGNLLEGMGTIAKMRMDVKEPTEVTFLEEVREGI